MIGTGIKHGLFALAALALTFEVSAPARAGELPQAGEASRLVLVEIGEHAPKELRGFYAARGNRPLWFAPDGMPSAAAEVLLEQLRSAEIDGLRPNQLKAESAARALVRAASGSTARIAAAEIALSQSYVRYVQALRQLPFTEMIYEGPALAPVVPTAAAALQTLAFAPSLERHVRAMGWMHPFYAPLRAALASDQLAPQQAQIVALNLARLRAIPPIAGGRWVMVDSVNARLWMFEGSEAVDSMKVVVGAPQTQTPIMAGFLRQAVVNPYWNMPDDLVPSRVTQPVLANGTGHLKAKRFQVLASWSEDAEVMDPRKVDWRAVAENRQSIRVRQLPGAGNFMGAVKFTFPNPQGIYLHDTPERALLAKPARHFSNGCVRLEDAARFGRWLLGKPLPRSATPEKRLDLAAPVPIYITYLTALPENGRITFRPDVYGHDAADSLMDHDTQTAR